MNEVLSIATEMKSLRRYSGIGRNAKSLNKASLVIVLALGGLALLYFSRPAFAANVTWNGLGADNNWSTGANWAGGVPPGSGDVAIFDATSTKNATIDVNINVQGIQINSGYTGTITQAGSNTITINSVGFAAFSQSDGIFNGGSGAIRLTGDANSDHNFNLSGGTFTSTSGTLFLSRSFNHNSGSGTFNHNGGTVTFDSAQNPSIVLSAAGETFNNLNFSKDNSTSIGLFGGNIIVVGALALNDGLINGATVEARGGVSVAPTFDGGNATLAIANGSIVRTFTFAAGVNLLNIVLNDPMVIINTSGSGVFNWRQLILQQGVVNQGGVDFNFFPPAGGGPPFSQSGGTFNGSSNAITFTSNGFGGFTQSGGTFNGGSGNIRLTGDTNSDHNFNLSGGTFTSTSGTLFLARGFTHNAGSGTFNHNNGTVTFDSSQNPSIVLSAAGETFNNLNFSKDNGTSIGLFGGNIIVVGALALNDGFINGATVEARGGVSVAPTFDGGNASFTFSGSANQTFTNSGGPNLTGTWTINKPSGKVTLASNLILNNSQPLNITSGTLDQGASFNLTAGAITIGSALGSGGRLTNQGTGDLTLGGTLTVNSGSTITLNGGGGGCGDADSILIRSSVDGSPRTWLGSGNFFLTDVDVKDQSAGNPPGSITVFNGTDQPPGGPSSNSNFIFVSGCNPTAGDSVVSGVIVADNDNPVEGAVVRLTGTQNRRVITDAHGFYRFDNVETNGFYAVTPSRVNFSFSPAQRSFSQLGNQTEAAFSGTPDGGNQNPLDTSEYFVRQHYLDFLGREPDEAGFNFWVNNIESCGADAQCRDEKRIDTSAAFFLSIEFQETGFMVYRTHLAAYGDMPNAQVPVKLNEFKPDTEEIGRGVIVLQSGWQLKLENNKQAYVAEFVQRPRFTAAYPSTMTPAAFVGKLFTNAGVTPVDAELMTAISEFGSAATSSDVAARGRALRRVAENSMLAQQEFNRSFVLMQYFGYLRRDPDSSPDADLAGYNFWLDKLNAFNGNFQDSEMCKAFLVSDEYRRRFRR